MKKRVLSLLLASTMAVGALSAGTCVASAEESEPDHIIMTYLTTGSTPADLEMVQDAVNEISIAEINVEVEFKVISISETFTNYSLWVASGEQVDLMCIAFQSLNTYANSGQILALDEYLESDGTYISELAEEFPLYDGAVINGSTYGVTPVMPCYGFRGGMVIREDYFEELGVEQQDQYTWDEITEILTAVKENHSDCYPACILGSSIGSTATNYGFFAELDYLGASSASGVLTSADSTEIVNIYATEEYKEFLYLMREWYELGLILPDAATTDSTATELMSSGKTCANPMNQQPVQLLTEASYGWNSVSLNMTEGYYPSASASAGTYWTIPITSENPEAAMKFLNLMYENQDVADLLKTGIEGVHYVTTDEDYVVAYPDGITSENTTYYEPLGLYGDRRYELAYSAGASIEENDAWTANNLSKQYMSVGYNYDTSNMTNQIIAVNSVLDQYLPSLETGSVEDVDTIYEQFLSALEVAGINDIIADNQAQFDAWLAENN
ncbi:MAG: ABC transporter substrate-binding protein [Lachnospiraceae bacterium]|nr:ABC transporter substrate-binding protein [Lachnospiraceae bacterium]